MPCCYGRNQCNFADNIDIVDVGQSEEPMNLLGNYYVLNCPNMISRPRNETSIDHVYSNICRNIFVDLIEFRFSDHNIISIIQIGVKLLNRDFDEETRF